MTRSCRASEVGGRARAPASKSSMQRAVACAALAAGESVLRAPSLCADSLAALGIARALGAETEIHPDRVVVRSRGFASLAAARAGELAPSPLAGQDPGARVVDCGESGLCLRMFTPIAALFPGLTRLEGHGSLPRRPVGPIEAPLRSLGARCEAEAGHLPVTVAGPLRGGEAVVDASASSQFLTGLLLALPLAQADSLLRVPAVVSGGYLDLTLRTMRAFGIEAGCQGNYDEIRLRGGRAYRPADFTVEGDWSGAAFLLVAAAVAGASAGGSRGLEIEGLDPASDQPDRAILEALRLAGAPLSWKDGTLRVGRARLAAFDFDATNCPDLFPPLAVLAARCGGESTFRGAGRLRAKESDRAAALSEELGSLGARIVVEGDLMRVRGGDLHGGRVDARGDHRIAMAAAVAALVADGEVEILGPECVAKSWPAFFEDLDALRQAGRG